MPPRSGVGGVHAGLVSVHESGEAVGIGLNGILADDQNAGDQLGTGDLLPFLIHIQGNAQALDLGQSAGHERLGQHGDGGLASLDLAQSLGGFAAVLDGDIVVGVDAVL